MHDWLWRYVNVNIYSDSYSISVTVNMNVVSIIYVWLVMSSALTRVVYLWSEYWRNSYNNSCSTFMIVNMEGDTTSDGVWLECNNAWLYHDCLFICYVVDYLFQILWLRTKQTSFNARQFRVSELQEVPLLSCFHTSFNHTNQELGQPTRQRHPSPRSGTCARSTRCSVAQLAYRVG